MAVNGDMFEDTTGELHATAMSCCPGRTKFLHNLWLLKALGRQLFSRGPPLGPHLLLSKLRGELGTKAVQEKFRAAVAEKKEKRGKPDPTKAMFRCAACCLGGQRDCGKQPAAFGACSPAEILSRIVRHGAWARCSACRDLADQCRAGAGKPSLAETEAARAPSSQPDVEETTFCVQCKAEQPRSYFSAATLHHEARAKRTPV